MQNPSMQRQVFNMIPAAVYTCDAEGRVTMFNDEAARLWGRVPVLGEDFWCGSHRLFRPDGTELPLEQCPIAEAILQKQAITREAIIERTDGTRRHVIANPRPLLDDQGRLVGAINLLVDITALKEGESRKDEFLATLSHELRNPLAPIRNALELMTTAADNPGLIAQARGVMERQLHQMVRLVDDLLDLSRIQRNKLSLHPSLCDIAAILRIAVETSRPLTEAGGHILTVEAGAHPIFVDADPARLGQVFSNLLNNAAKYTPRGGNITVMVLREGEDVVVRVRDNGLGIPARMQFQLFESFRNVERPEGSAGGGLGIGLSIAKRIVDLHRGQISGKSAGPGLGSEFEVRLPAVHSTAVAKSAKADKPAADSWKRRVLVADDNLDSASTLALLVELLGSDVRVASNGSEAVELAAEYRPQLVLLDIGMPVLDGYEACRKIRQQPGGADTIIVALTGWGQAGDRKLSREAGFDQHLVKPVDRSALETLLAMRHRAQAAAPIMRA